MVDERQMPLGTLRNSLRNRIKSTIASFEQKGARSTAIEKLKVARRNPRNQRGSPTQAESGQLPLQFHAQVDQAVGCVENHVDC